MTLRDYQKEIAEQACNLLRCYNIAYLCMEVRTGKTLTAFATASMYGADRVLFVTKKKAISSIQADFKAAGEPFSLYVTNYEQLSKVESGLDIIIVDEAHSIGSFPNPSDRAKELKRICAGKPIIYLSGTPTPESYSQLFHQFWISDYSPYREYQTFYAWHKDFGIPASKFIYNRQIADYSKTRPEARDWFNQLSITYTQEDAGFKCDVIEEILTVPMSHKVKWAVDTLRNKKILTTKDGHTVLADTAVKEMLKVHQACSGTLKAEPVDGKDGYTIAFDDTKASFIKERFAGKKIAVFYKYTAELTLLKKHFAGRIVEDPIAFNKSDSDAVFVSQVQSGREGLNLSTADALIFYNIDFSALSYWQARARIQTLNRSEPARVYWIFTQGGIEKKIYDMVMNKKDFTLTHYKKATF